MVRASQWLIVLGFFLWGSFAWSQEKRESLPYSWADYPLNLDHSKDTAVKLDSWVGVKFLDLEGDLRFGSSGTLLDLGSRAGKSGLASSGGITTGGEVEWQGFSLGFEADLADFEESFRVSDQGFRAFNRTFFPNTVLELETQYRDYRWTLGYLHYLTPEVALGLNLCLDYWQFDFRLTSRTLADPGSITVDYDAVIPGLGFRFRWIPQERIVIEVEPSGSWFDADEDQIWYLQIPVTVNVFATSQLYLFVRAGWEFEDYNVEEKDTRLDVQMRSSLSITPGLGVRF